ncbi:ring-opening amidohydrolase [Jiella sp. MQZ9-1]|uniref:Cyanuric acid amidohydrolase n=1 Tax=Jiella flava TaxID=2816857 RepID=A0A939FUD0_9HYPH|nr:ring-opening amidohydrolase [Jiella flava]MBO0660984.1 ring-opening amidohydrolase [Jiella flava]MCD2469632.1 ring-opening amidohydrolase [Jiella flava]
MRQAQVHLIATRAPDDVSGLEAAIAAGQIEPAAIAAILGKTEGNGCVNDFTRAFAVSALKAALGRSLPDEAVAQIAMVMSGGTEGALSPHLIVFERRGEPAAAPAVGRSALAIGVAHTDSLLPEQLGRMDEVEMVANGVAAAMRDAGIDDPADVHFVQIKCPLLTVDRIAAAEARGASVVTRDTLKSMGFTRGASALGVALALGEIAADALSEAAIGRDTDLWSGRASTSAGVELLNHEIVVLGMSRSWSGPLAIDHAVMDDAIDILPVRDALRRLGFAADGQLTAAERGRLVAVLAKAEPGSSGRLRGARHTMLDDSDLSATRHARAFVGGALAALTGSSALFVSGGAEHQGPDGGGPVAIIARRFQGER